jgi:hypothetical protein
MLTKSTPIFSGTNEQLINAMWHMVEKKSTCKTDKAILTEAILRLVEALDSEW